MAHLRENHGHDTQRHEVTHRLDESQLEQILCCIDRAWSRAYADALSAINTKLAWLTNTQEILMARSQEMNDLITKLNSATNNLATRIQGLEDRIKNSGMSAEDEAAAIAELGAIGTTLENMGANPNEPLPPPEPTPNP